SQPLSDVYANTPPSQCELFRPWDGRQASQNQFLLGRKKDLIQPRDGDDRVFQLPPAVLYKLSIHLLWATRFHKYVAVAGLLRSRASKRRQTALKRPR